MKTILSCSLILLLLAPSSATAEEWTKAEIAKEIGFEVLQVIDGFQTDEIFNNPDFYEINPALTEDNFIFLMGLTAIVHPIVTHYLPRKECERLWCLNKERWQNWTLGFKVGLVGHNFSVGIRW